MAKKRTIITIDKDYRENISQIVKELEDRNITVEEQLPVLNRIICSVEESEIKDLETVSGVKKVTQDKIFKIQ